MVRGPKYGSERIVTGAGYGYREVDVLKEQDIRLLPGTDGTQRSAAFVSSIGYVVRARRLELGLTQEQLAEKIGGQVTQADVSRLERGRVGLPRRPRLESIARALDLPVGELLLRSGWAGAEQVQTFGHAPEPSDPLPHAVTPNRHLSVSAHDGASARYSDPRHQLRAATARSRRAREHSLMVLAQLEALRMSRDSFTIRPRHTFDGTDGASPGMGAMFRNEDGRAGRSADQEPAQDRNDPGENRLATFRTMLDGLSAALITAQRLRRRAESSGDGIRDFAADLRHLEAMLKELATDLVQQFDEQQSIDSPSSAGD
jgi:transcriptional regulator with XRE-family HTH domain